MKMKGIIHVDHLSFSYGKVNVFSDFSLSVNEGEFVSIVGCNKSGKTTLMKLLAGLLPSNGKISVNYVIADSKNIDYTAPTVGVLLGELDNQFLFDDVYHELAFPLENLALPKAEIDERIGKVTRLLKINDLVDRKIDKLTMSEKAKLLLAVAIIHDPKVLLLDSPFCMMKKSDRMEMIAILRYLVDQKGLTVLLTSNDLMDALYADYLYVLDNGRIAVEGDPIAVMREDKLIGRLNLELPFMVDLSNKLKLYGLLDEVIIDMDRMVDTLWK